MCILFRCEVWVTCISARYSLLSVVPAHDVNGDKQEQNARVPSTTTPLTTKKRTTYSTAGERDE